MKKLVVIGIVIALATAATVVSQRGSQNPHGKLKWDCQSCHTSESWTKLQQPLKFDHGETGFPLVGAHKTASCIGCHKDLVFSKVAHDCAQCHNDVHKGQLGNQCQNCHTSEDWQSHRDMFDLHAQKGFALSGVHAIADCESCHRNQEKEEYASTPVECQGCHQVDFAGTANPNHIKAGFSFQCQDCHHTGAFTWKNASYEHPATFPIQGGHANIECQTCHTTQYAGLDPTCFSCHSGDFSAATDPNHQEGNFDHDCTKCHTIAAWTPATFDHNTSRFPLTGAHASVKCADCHSAGFAGTPTDCYSCHQQQFTGVKDPDHVQGNFDHNCTACHTTVAWKPATFDHNTTQFPLTGAHQSVDCASCHTTTFAGTPKECYSCHQDKFASVTDPNHVSGNFNHDCTQCHTTAAWTPATFDHNQTQFPLTGAHASVTCISCHASGFTGTSTACYSCHQDKFVSVTDPNHVAGNFNHDCTQCHTTTAWTPATFDHNQTQFPLTGAHASVTCISCHASGFTGTSTACYSCHQDKFASVTDPNHVSGNFNHDCTQCHTTAAWTPASFDHSQSAFPLTGKHTTVACADCHTHGFTGTPTDCYSCHQSAFASTTEPNHVQNNFNHDCTTCHATSGWTPSTFNHSATAFPLTGAHASLTCISCHSAGYVNTPTACYSCHQGDFASTTDPNHVQANLSHECQQCHGTNSWAGADFDHSTTGFPLTGKHVGPQCIDCHSGGYTNTSPACYSCHQSAFEGTTDPNHVQNNFDHDCSKCHTTNGWSPASFDHSTTGFPLTGKHVGPQCIDCHSGGYTNTSPACYSCHQSAFEGTTDPNHVQNNFDHDCSKCHTTNGWSPASFDHSTTGFPLTGKHVGPQCIDCHSGGYTNTSPACYSCHQSAFEGTTDPNHVQNNFDHDCSKCHTTNGWSPASFDHSTTGFPLTGKHVGPQCIDCHSGGYTNTSPACYSCHQSAFEGTTDPNHVQNNFDHDCSKCHTTNGWSPASFDHNTTGFPLTGKHTTIQCIDCHSAGYTNTSPLCYSCHQAAFEGTTDPNHVQNNFDHDCSKCHTTNGWSPASFDHSTTGFPLTGKHTTIQCIDCHSAGYTNTSPLCYSCHQAAFEGTTDPNHVQNNFDHDCSKCHSTNNWDDATFDHNNTNFPLTGAHTSLNCIACHSAGYVNTPTTCDACHHGDFTGTTDPNHVAAAFSVTCTGCHTTTAWQPSSWSHTSTGYALTGQHATQRCITCHGSNYTSISTACYDCHQAQYAGTTDPNHQSANFPTTCETCHTTSGWTPANWDHDGQYFPIYSGNHQNVWSSCATCHVNPADYSDFECINCHEHNRSDTDSHHQDVNNYQYLSTACYSCHPRGRAD